MSERSSRGRRRALLIGCQTYGLAGVDNDIAAVRAWLAPGFELDVRTGARATRDAIVAAYNSLIENTRAGDVALVYYSGHGCSLPDPGDARGRSRIQHLVPTDFSADPRAPFRGITSTELSALQLRLTEKTANVSVILDCCYAARMSRDLAVRARALPELDGARDGGRARAHLDALGPIAAVVETNERAVRLVASSMWEPAYEAYDPVLGAHHGRLTAALLYAARRAGSLEHVTWDMLYRAIRARVQSLQPEQRPAVEGPSSRVIFGLRRVSADNELDFERRAGASILCGGRLHGVSSGDRYELLPRGPAPRRARARPELVVESVGFAESVVRVEPAGGEVVVPERGRAALVERAFRRALVHVDADVPRELVKSFRESPFVEIAQRSARAHLIVRGASDQLALHDASGRPLVHPGPRSPENALRVLASVEQYASAHALRALAGTGEGGLSSRVSIAWRRVDGTGSWPLAPAGEALFTGDRICLDVDNRSERTLWVNILDIGVSYQVARMTRSAHEGIELVAGARYTLGRDTRGRAVGIRLSWSDVVPRDGPRLESLLVIVTGRPLDVRSLEASGVVALRRLTAASRLEADIQQIALGGTRDVRAELPASAAEDRAGAYMVSEFRFLAFPGPRR